MQLPENVRLFRDLSLLHDTALSDIQRANILANLRQEDLKSHEHYVQGLLGAPYSFPTTASNRSKPWLFAWLRT